jgi:hypothetical protein
LNLLTSEPVNGCLWFCLRIESLCNAVGVLTHIGGN